MRRIVSFVAALAVIFGCNPPELTLTYSVTGEIIDPDASLSRLVADMHVMATNKSDGKVYVASVGSEDAVTCRYSRIRNSPVI